MMRLRKLRKGFKVILLLTVGMVLSGGAVFASDGDPDATSASDAVTLSDTVTLMEINDDHLISITEELKNPMQAKQRHLDFFSVSTDIQELSRAAEGVFTGSFTKAHVLPVEPDQFLSSLLPQDEQEKKTIDEEELWSIVGYHFGSILVSQLNAQMGVNHVALSSILTVSRSFVADLDQETLVVLEYDGEFSLVADFYSSGDHVMTVTETIMPSSMVSNLLEMLAVGE